MTSVFSWQNSVQPLTCFILYSKAKLACYPRYLLASYFCIPEKCKKKKCNNTCKKKSRKLHFFLEFLKLQVGLYCQAFIGTQYYSNITIKILEISQVQAPQITLPDHRNRTAFLLEKHANHYHVCYILPYLFCMKSFSHREFLELRHIKSYRKDSHFSWVSTNLKQLHICIAVQCGITACVGSLQVCRTQ